jgi:Concanavalin A-like lectin/glucanases superfamily
MKSVRSKQWRKITLNIVLSVIAVLSISLMLIPSAFAADSNNIVGSWHLDEGKGNIAQDSSKNLNAGTLKTSIGNGPTWIDRKFDTAALRLAGRGSVEIPDSEFLRPKNITVEAWIKRSPIGVSVNEYVIAKGAKECVAASYAFYTVANGDLAFYIFDGAGAFVESPPAAASKVWDDRWHHVAGTYDGKMVRLYVDGKEIDNGRPTTLTIGYNLSSSNDLHIGIYGYKCVADFGGEIDEVRVWNEALTDDEVRLRAS